MSQLEAMSLIFDSAKDYAIVTLDLDRKVTSWNPGAQLMLGFADSEILGRPLDFLYVPEDRASGVPEEEAAKALREGRAENERWHVRKDGTHVYCSGMLRPLKPADGGVIGFVKIMRDLTEQKRTEEALRLAQQRLQRVLETDAVGILFFDLTGTVIDANHVFLSMTGYTREDIDGRKLTWRSMTPPEWIQRSEDQLELLARTGKIGPYEKEYFLKSGERRWMLFTGRDLGDGTISEYCVDIQPLKAAEAAVRASEDQFRRAIEDAPIPVIMHAEDGEVLGLSRTWTELTGYRPEDIPTLDAWLARASADADRVREPLQSLFHGQGRQLNLECEVITCAGQKRLWNISASAPGTLRDGRAFVVAMAVDITDRKQAEEALKKSRQKILEAFAGAEKARREAEAANATKDRFLANLSHELRTPLMPVLMTVGSLIKQEELPAPVVSSLKMISRNIESLSRLIDDLLGLTAVGKVPMEVAESTVDLREVLRKSVEATEEQFLSRRQKIAVSLPGTAQVRGEFHRLQQVFMHLLNNASKFSLVGGEIRVVSRTEPGMVCVDIVDFGRGIDSTMLPEIFHPFKQGDAQIAREHGGLGIGLSISKATVESFGGTIQATSEGLGRGATFTVKLPKATN